MPRLFWRIFLSFWLVIILTIAGIAMINHRLDQARQTDSETSQRAERMASGLRLRALRALNAGGPSALADWASRQAGQRRRFDVLVLDDDGHELNGQRITRSLREVVQAWKEQRELPADGPGRRFTTALDHARHGRYLVIVEPPPRPLVLRVLGSSGLPRLLLVAGLFSGLVCFWLSRTLTRPIDQLRLTGQALGRGDLSARAPESTARRRDELGELATDFNRMAGRIEDLVNNQRQLLRDVSHELRSPLSRLQVALALVEDSGDETIRRRYLKHMEQDLERLNELIGEMLRFTRIRDGQAIESENLDLVELVEAIVESARLEAQPRQVQVELDAPLSLSLRGDAELLGRAIENVVRNALRHTPDNSTITINLQSDADDACHLSIRDQGPGVPSACLEAIFHPFVRLSPERGESGTGGGIGLAIAKAAIERHQGTIVASNGIDGGLEVHIRIPATLPSTSP